MRKRLLATAIVFAVAIMITIPFNSFLGPSTAVAQQQQQVNSNTSSSPNSNTSSPNPLPLKTIFKQVENAVQVTSKIPTTGVPNPLNPQSEKLFLPG